MAGKGFPKASGLFRPDWVCAACGDHQFARNTECRKCGGPKTGDMGATPGFWECPCGFRNKAANEVCGGNGPMGCKSPNSGGGSSFGPACAKGGGKGIAFSPYSGLGGWVCSCGFRNKESNTLCGGTGPAGCKAMHNLVGQVMHLISDRGKGKGAGFKAPGLIAEWICACGFQNKPANDICGGAGPLGCNGPRGKGVGKATNWDCSACGFKNIPSNQVCGGAGNMGCKAEKPQDWVCECSFVNNPKNAVCGGLGAMGCRKAKPEGGPLRHFSEASGLTGGPAAFQQSSLAGNWACAECDFVNNSRNVRCGGNGLMGCKIAKPEVGGIGIHV